MAYTPAPQVYLQCPYEKSHVILAEKMQFHLTKCEYVHSSTSPMSECPFNSTHRIREVEMNYHKMHSCPDRHKFENFVYSTRDTTCLHPIVTVECTSSENWDDVNVATYNPAEHCENRCILMSVQGVTPSERKSFRQLQRKKTQALRERNPEHCKPVATERAVRLPRTPARAMMENDNGSNMPATSGYQASDPISSNSERDEDGFEVPRYLSRGRNRGRGRGRGCGSRK